MTSEEVSYVCGECGATLAFRPAFDVDMPVGWYRLEDRGCYYVVCSGRCCQKLLETLEPGKSVPAVVAPVDDASKLSTRDSSSSSSSSQITLVTALRRKIDEWRKDADGLERCKSNGWEPYVVRQRANELAALLQEIEAP